ncbi:MAG: TonB-dependent receptor [Bacteroidales bacterium]|nr:TonB-dependent receptor [Bacteroidales bacterium]
MFKKLLVIVGIVLSGFSAAAQNKVTGKVVDASTLSPEPGAVVQLFTGGTETENMKGYAISDSLGLFSISYKNIQPGTESIVQVMNMGRKTVQKTVTLREGTTDAGAIALEDDIQAIQSSKISAAKPLIKMDADKISYDVENDTDAKASNVLDLLRKVPMVTVDGQDNITVNGSSSFKVYVDGKPNQMISANPSKVFKSMPASAVKGIEVITNPGAKYDAEGTGGVLNLTMARTEDGKSALPDGASGSVSAGIDTQGSLSGGLYLNAKKGKLTVGGDIYTGLERQWDLSQETNQHFVSTKTDIAENYHVAKSTNPYLFGDINASYELDTLNLFSASLGIMSWAYNQDATGSGSATVGGTPLYSYDGFGSASGGSNGINASFDWQHNFAGNKEKMFTLSYRFSGDPENQFTERRYDNVTGTAMNDVKVDGKNVSQEHTFQADYTTPIAKGQTLSSGLKYIYRNNYSNDEYYIDPGTGYVLQPTKDSEYHHHNNIAAAYTEYAGSFGKFSTKVGLRYEYTFLDVQFEDGTSYDGHYDNLVPNVSLQYNLGQTSNLGLTYNMRISRPGITYLNPFVNRGEPNKISYGNPDIQPEKTHNFGLKYNYFSPKFMLNAGLMYRFGEGGISSYQKYAADPDDPSRMILHSTYGNIVSNSTYGVNWFINWNPVKDTRIYTSSNLGYTVISSPQLNQSNSGFNGHFMFGAQQTIFWDMRLSANLFGATKRYTLQGWGSGFSGLSLGVSKSFLEEKLNVSLRGFTNVKGGKYFYFENYTEGKDFTTHSKVYIPIRSVGIELTYNFGKSNIQVKKAQRTITNDDVVNAQNAMQQQSAQTSMQQ